MSTDTTNPTYAVVTTLAGDPRRMNLVHAERTDIGEFEWRTGVELVAVYYQRRAQRVVVETFSRWDDGRGRIVGRQFTEADNETIAELARKFDELEHLAELLPELE